MTLNKPQGKNFPSTSATDPRRQAAIRINFAAGLLLFLASIPTLATRTPEISLTYIGNLITLAMALISFLSAWVCYRYDATRGSVLFIAALLFVSLGIPVYAHGLGLQSGIIVAILVTGVAATTLPAGLAARVSALAVVVESAVILADLYLPDLGIGKLQSAYINLFLVVIVLVFAYYSLRQYASYAFRAKLIIAFALVAVTAVSAAAIGLNTIGKNELTRQAGSKLNELANTLAETVGTNLSSETVLLQTVGAQFEDFAGEASQAYSGKKKTEILEQINAVDASWRVAADNSQLVQSVVSNPVADKLREFQKVAPQHVELFITDRFGANLAATNRTSDYFQADEEWWQTAYNDGEGTVYISQPEFDESSNTYAVLMAIPIFSDNKLVGILRSTLNVTAIRTLLDKEKDADLGHADILVSGNQFISSDTLTPEEITGLKKITGSFGEFTFEGEPSLVSQQKIHALADSPAWQSVEALNWNVIIHQPLEQALLPVENQTRATISISMLVLALAVLFGYLVSQRLASPIVNLTHVTSQIAQGDLKVRANSQTQDEIGALSDSFNRMTDQLQETLNSLENRVAERTTDLEQARLQSEKRARDLQSISEISRIISSEQRLDILLPLITRLVSEKFDFYHAGIFLTDETRQSVALQAANSEGGQRMLNRSHRLELGTGIVGNVAQTGTARVTRDVGADAVFFDNPDLPATRSEMAIPLNARGTTIGVLDVQSAKPGEFTDNIVNTLGILGDQIAIAIENARLFSRTQQALAEAQTLYSQYLQKEWKAFRGKTSNVGYHQSTLGGKPLETPMESTGIKQALQHGEVVLGGSDANTEPAVIVPIKLRGETIGVLNIKASSKNYAWSKDEINMIESVSERLALALENARLFEETNRRAERERIVSEITGKIRSVNDPQTMIQTALEELRNALGASRIQMIPQASTSAGKTN
ncbi:MAG: GAF domain-containing protein [Anaerolineales bacterium]|nr:GAF domain-containing protein [Anaerolineales bacterium]